MKTFVEFTRDYKAEYKKFQSSPERIKYRAELVKYNRDKGTYGNGDNKDASHKGGKIVGFEDQSKNRGRAEASRLKKKTETPNSKPNPHAVGRNIVWNKTRLIAAFKGKKTKAVSTIFGQPDQRLGDTWVYHGLHIFDPFTRRKLSIAQFLVKEDTVLEILTN